MKKFWCMIFACGVLAVLGCSDDSDDDSEEAESSASVAVSDSTVYDTVTVYVDDTTGKSLHYVGNSALRITEICTQNVDWLDHDGEDPGWVEIYNAGSDTADLRGYSLVEDLDEPRSWIFDQQIIPPGKLRTVFCSKKDITAPLSGTDSDDAHYRTHTNWKLNDEGGTVYLIDYNWGIRDSVAYPELATGISWGIVNGGDWKYYSTPTPEKKNTSSTAYDGFAGAVSLSPAGGFYDDSVVVSISEADSGATVRCSSDGSAPTDSSDEWTGSLTISATTVLRCAAFADGKITNEYATETYFIGESVNMPVVAISVAPDYFENYYYYTSSCAEPCYTAGYWEDVEYPVHVEYFASGSSSSSKAWEIDAGISIMGGWSRYLPKKSVSIVMREQYQDGRLVYSLFDTRPEDNVFKAFNLRNNGNRFYWDYILDPMASSLLEGSGVDYQRSRQVVVFYNGEYYGIHDMREKLNEHFIVTNYDYDSDDVDFVKHIGTEITASGGSTSGYETLLDYVYSNDFSGEDNSAYVTASAMMDMGNFADYMAAQIYYHNGDWPNNNVRAWRTSDQPWKFVVFDLDHGFEFTWYVSGFSSSTNMFDWIEAGGGGDSPCSGEGCFAVLYNKLIENPDFKRLFINHSAVMLDYYLTYERVVEFTDAMVATIDASEMTRDMEKFPRTSTSFSTDGANIKSWASTRTETVKEEYQSEFGVGDDIEVSISSSGNGIVQLDGMTLPSTSYTGNFFSGNDMLLTAVPSGSAVFSAWEDGSTDNPRTVTPSDGDSYVATFK